MLDVVPHPAPPTRALRGPDDHPGRSWEGCRVGCPPHHLLLEEALPNGTVPYGYSIIPRCLTPSPLTHAEER